MDDLVQGWSPDYEFGLFWITIGGEVVQISTVVRVTSRKVKIFVMRSRLRKALILVLLFVGVSATPVGFAQEGSDIVIDHSAEVVFPAVVQFHITLRLELDSISSVSLDIVQGDRTLRSGAVVVDDSVFSTAPYTQLQVDWAIPLADTPALFEPLAYRWILVDSEGGQAEVEGEIGFEPSGASWRHGGGPPLTLSVYESTVNIASAQRAVMQAYDLMAVHTGLDPEIKWAIFPRGFTFCVQSTAGDESFVAAASGDTYACEEDSARDVFAANGYRVLIHQNPGLLPFQNELVADLFEVFYSDYWSGLRVPEWFRSGLKQLYYLAPDPLALRTMQEAVRLEQLFDSPELDSTPTEPDALEIWEKQAYTMLLYLADSIGVEVLFDLAAALPDSNFATLLEETIAGQEDYLLVSWERWLFTEEAESAVTWTVYAPATATPYPTQTASSVPPSDTPVPVASSMPLPSETAVATSRVANAPTPLPTYTPFSTLPPLPSNTPRPPGSLGETAPDDGGSAQGGRTICPAMLPSILLPAVALGVVRRRKQTQ